MSRILESFESERDCTCCMGQFCCECSREACYVTGYDLSCCFSCNAWLAEPKAEEISSIVYPTIDPLEAIYQVKYGKKE